MVVNEGFPFKERDLYSPSLVTPNSRASAVMPLERARAFSRGELPEDAYRVHIPERVNVKAIREQTGLSQAAFANRFGFSVCALRNWEQGKRQPDPAVRAYLKVIEKAPDVVANALNTPGPDPASMPHA
jgi:putative transcriptional regulator